MVPTSGQQPEDNDTTQIEPVESSDTEKLLHQATNLLGEGHVQQAIDLCQQAIRHNPEAADVYVLLGMAEEEHGNLHLAIEAYQQALSIEPERTREREKIALLEERLAEEASVTEFNQQRLQRLVRWAPTVLGVSVALLILVATTAGIIRVRQGREVARQQQAYQAAIQQGQNLVAAGRYNEAINAFRQAQQIRPDAPEARQWGHRAYTLAQQDATYKDYMQRSGAGKVSLKPAPNPFAAVPIGPKSAEPQGSSGSGGSAVPSPTVPGSAQWDVPAPTIPEGAGPLVAPPEFLPGEAAVSEPPPAPAASGEVSPQKPKSQITIEVQPPREATGGSSGDELRAAADQLRYEGRHAEAVKKYHQAQDQYQREAQQDPITTSAKQSAIESCQQAIKIIE